MTSFRHICMKNKREIRRQSVKLSQGKPNPTNVLFRQFIDIPMLTAIDLGKRTSLHGISGAVVGFSFGWGQPGEGAMPRVLPKTKNSSDLAH